MDEAVSKAVFAIPAKGENGGTSYPHAKGPLSGLEGCHFPCQTDRFGQRGDQKRRTASTHGQGSSQQDPSQGAPRDHSREGIGVRCLFGERNRERVHGSIRGSGIQKGI